LRTLRKLKWSLKISREFRAGDTLRVAVEIQEGEKSRIQNFEGVCISVRGEGIGKTFTVRRIGANSVGVERNFPIYADSVKGITGKV